jgi:hypothetical protein
MDAMCNRLFTNPPCYQESKTKGNKVGSFSIVQRIDRLID